MDKDRVKGAIDQVVGIAKQTVGDLAGNPKLQVEGAMQNVKGKLENAWGKLKDEAREANDESSV